MARGTWKDFKEGTSGEVKVAGYNARVDGRWILYMPTFSPTPEIKEWGGRWDGTNKCWRLPRLARMARKIQEFDPKARCSREVEVLLNEWDIPFEVAMEKIAEFASTHPAIDSLYPYQVQGVCALVLRKFMGKLCILSPGLGKTPTAIVAADVWWRFVQWSLNKGVTLSTNANPRFLVVAPMGGGALVGNWTREINGPLNPPPWIKLPDRIREHGWSEHDGHVNLLRRTNLGVAGETTWSVTNPEVLFARERLVKDGPLRITGKLDPAFDQEWDVLILDESVLYKNRKSKRSQIVRSLRSHAQQTWELSGAPTTHDNSDIWQQLQIAEPDYFSSFWKFANEFCVVERTTWSQGEIMGSRHGMELRNEFPDMLFVRNQEEVFEDLPRVIYEDIELPLTRRQKKAHDDIMDQWFHELEYNADSRVDVTAVISQLTRLQQVTSNLKNLETTGKHWPDESSKADAVESRLALGTVTFPALIWVWHKPGAHALRDRLLRAAEGKTKAKKQHPLYGKRIEMVLGGNKKADQIIEAYKAGEVDILILSIGVGKYGHTLANTRTIIFYDRTWDSDAIFQALHRYAGARGRLAGYEHNPLCMVLRCRGTVDDFVEMNLAGKLPDMASLTGSDLIKILRSLGKDYVEALEDAEEVGE